MPSIEERVAKLEKYFAEVIVGSQPKWRAKHLNVPVLSDISVDLGDITAGNAMFGQALNRSIGFGDDLESFWARDEYNRFYFRVGYTADYFRLGRASRPAIEYVDGEVQTDGLTIIPNTVPYTAMLVGPIAYNFLGYDTIEFGAWNFSADDISSYDNGKLNVVLSGQTGSISTYRLNNYDVDIRTRLHDGTLSVYNISTITDLSSIAAIDYVNVDASIGIGEPGRFRTVRSYSDGDHNVYFRNMDNTPIGLILGNYTDDLAWLKNSSIRLTSTYGLARLDQTLVGTEAGDVTLKLEVTNEQTEVSMGSLSLDGLTWIFSKPVTIPTASVPADPLEGNAVMWVSAAVGTVGDVMMKITAGSTKTATLVDFSAV